jgi:hypothetical protein
VNRRIIIVGVLVLLLCAIVAGAAGAVLLLRSPEVAGVVEEVASLASQEPPTGVPLPEGDLGTQMAAVEAQVSEARDLEPLTEVSKDFMSEAELREVVEQDFLEEYSPEEARDDALVLSAFDFLSPDLDLYTLYVDLYTEQIAGYYDSEEDRFFLISAEAELDSYQRLIFAHEYTHALQDQHFDLESFDRETLYEENPDAAIALDALIEGDAQLLTESYLRDYFSGDDLQSLFTELDAFQSPVYDGAPPLVQRDLNFPYVEGSRFVQALYEEGGWRLVDEAYADPPTSTEQILHPERYLNRDEPQPVALQPTLNVLGVGWRLVYEGTFGEFYVLAYLEQQVDPTVAATAGEGWGGDRYAVYQHEGSGQVVMELRLAWDSPLEAGEFAAAYREYGAGRAGRDPTTSREDLTCWTAQDYLCVVLSGAETWVVLGPNRPTVIGVLAQYGIAG